MEKHGEKKGKHNRDQEKINRGRSVIIVTGKQIGRAHV